MEKEQWEELYRGLSGKYENYYENYLVYRREARKNKKRVKKEIISTIEWTFHYIRDNDDLLEILHKVTRRLGVESKLIKKPEYYLEVVEEVLKSILIKIDQMD